MKNSLQLSDAIHLLNSEIGKMKDELSRSKAPSEVLHYKKKRVELFELVANLFGQIDDPDRIFSLANTMKIFKRRDSEMDGFIIYYHLKQQMVKPSLIKTVPTAYPDVRNKN